jgi:hypothetical protein
MIAAITVASGAGARCVAHLIPFLFTAPKKQKDLFNYNYQLLY